MNDDEATGCAELVVCYPNVISQWRLVGSHITDKGAQVIATIHDPALMRLVLSNNSIGDAGSAALAEALHHNSTLQLLDLSNNCVGDTGSAALAQALHRTSTLMELNLSGNDTIGKEGTFQLIQAVTVNKSLGTNMSALCGLVLPRRCEEFATQGPWYNEVKHRTTFKEEGKASLCTVC